MKKSKFTSLFLFSLLFLAMTMVSSVYAGEGDTETTQEVVFKNFVEYDLSLIQKKKYLLPGWMLFNSSEEVCSSGNSDYRGYTKFLANDSCKLSFKYSPKLNNFSKQFFETTIDGTVERVNVEEIEDEEDNLLGSNEAETEADLVEDESSSIDSGEEEDILSTVFGSLDEGEEDDSEEESSADEEGNQEEDKEEDESEEEVVQEDTVLQLVGGQRVLKLSEVDDNYVGEVQEALGLIIGDGEMKVVEDESEEIVEEEEVDEEFVFGDAQIHDNVNIFIKGIFLSDVKDLLFATRFTAEDISLSESHLAMALNSFTPKIEVIASNDYKLIGLEGFDYYNKLLSKLYSDFSLNVSTDEYRKIVAKDISDVTFSLSNYTDRNLHDNIRESFRKKFIIDIQKLEKDYSGFIEKEIAEKEKIAKERMTSFFMNKMKPLETAIDQAEGGEPDITTTSDEEEEIDEESLEILKLLEDTELED